MGNCITHNTISEETRKNAKPFIPQITEGIVVKVYDGDTITIVSKLPYKDSDYYRFSVRLLWIDSAEIKGKEKEKEIAIRARDALSAKILNRTITLRNVTTEKYGRLLANVYLDDECINDWMLKNGHAVPYDGGKKLRPDEWGITPDKMNELPLRL
jgi:micrococcal nuclease